MGAARGIGEPRGPRAVFEHGQTGRPPPMSTMTPSLSTPSTHCGSVGSSWPCVTSSPAARDHMTVGCCRWPVPRRHAMAAGSVAPQKRTLQLPDKSAHDGVAPV
jgi:hypothetical protein